MIVIILIIKAPESLFEVFGRKQSRLLKAWWVLAKMIKVGAAGVWVRCQM